MKKIIRNKYPQIDRQNIQERVAMLAEGNPDAFLRKYEEDSRSQEGRYVCSDLMKEMFPEYANSAAERARYNNPVHNTAAVLADEQFSRVVKDNSTPERDQAIFVTGVPGAGKTTAINNGGEAPGQIPENVRVVYEGQLANHETAIPKIQQCIDAGLTPTIIALHIKPEQALQNTLERFEQEGRGASIQAMATIQSNLPDGLQKIHETFGEQVNLVVLDRSHGLNESTELHGWENLTRLQEGNYEQLKQRLDSALQQYSNEYEYSNDAIRQANGLATSGIDQEIRHEHDTSIEQIRTAIESAEEAITNQPSLAFGPGEEAHLNPASDAIAEMLPEISQGQDSSLSHSPDSSAKGKEDAGIDEEEEGYALEL